MNKSTALEMRTFQTEAWICIFKQVIKLEVGETQFDNPAVNQ